METTVITPLTEKAFPVFANLCKEYGETFALRVLRQFVHYYTCDIDFALDVADDYELRTGDSGPVEILTALRDSGELHRVATFFYIPN